MKSSYGTWAFATLVATLGSVAHAQATNGGTDHPKAIGTSQQTADEATKKAASGGNAPLSVVRTGPTAGDRASEAASATKDKAKQAVSTTKSKAASAKDKVTGSDGDNDTGANGTGATGGTNGSGNASSNSSSTKR